MKVCLHLAKQYKYPFNLTNFPISHGFKIFISKLFLTLGKLSLTLLSSIDVITW